MVGGALGTFTGICLKLQPLGEIWRWGEPRSHRVLHVRVGPASLGLPAVSGLPGRSHLRPFTHLNILKAGSAFNVRQICCTYIR